LPLACCLIGLFVGDGQHFFQRGHAQLDLVQARFAQERTLRGGLLGDLQGAAVAQDDALISP
jgi:hypothetical protein